jgi:uncharacterized membrane protein YcgQ (UPF0703/DUF1980 family)
MKKLTLFTLLLCCISIIFTEVRADPLPDKEIVVINEKFFIQQCEDVYINPDDYEDKLIEIEGLCDIVEQNDEKRYFVYRNTPGCCGADGTIGFRFLYKGEEKLAQKDWISVIASVNVSKTVFGLNAIVLDAMEIKVKEEHGAEFVRF